MVNLNKIKNMAAFVVPQMLTTLSFFLTLVFYNIYYAAGVFVIATAIFTVLGRAFMKNPFTQLVEGEGILALDMTSTGIIRPFIVGLAKGRPYLTGEVNGNKVKGIFNRSSVTQLNAPVEAGNHYKIVEDKEGHVKLYFNIDLELYNAARFQLNSFPVLIYNSQIDSILTKDFLSAQEKSVFAEHTLLYLNQKLDELTSLVRDFGRGVVESLKPKFNPLGSWVVYAVLFVILIVLAILFGPAILESFSGTGAIASNALETTNSAISPRG